LAETTAADKAAVKHVLTTHGVQTVHFMVEWTIAVVAALVAVSIDLMHDRTG